MLVTVITALRPGLLPRRCTSWAREVITAPKPVRATHDRTGDGAGTGELPPLLYLWVMSDGGAVCTALNPPARENRLSNPSDGALAIYRRVSHQLHADAGWIVTRERHVP